MKTPLLFFFILMNYFNSAAQDTKHITVKAGTSILNTFTTTDVFLYPQFITGKVYFRNSTNATAMMNYNSLTDQMLFIDLNHDTLALKDEKTIKYITLDKDTFYYNEGYIRLVASNSVVKVAERRVWKVADIRRIGSHDRPSKTFAVTTQRTLTDGFGRTYNLVLNEDLVLRKKSNYYFGDTYNHFVPSGKKNLLELFFKEQTSLAKYLKENKVNYDRRDDLEKIARFLEQNY